MSHQEISHSSIATLPPVEVPTPEEVRQIEAAAGRQRRASGLRKVIVGGFLCILGLGTTVMTYAVASELGGNYLVWYGPILIGLWILFTGVMDLRSGASLRSGPPRPWADSIDAGPK